MRCADFGPTPGRQRSASIRRLSDGGYSMPGRAQPNGSLRPGGRFMPPIRPDIFSCVMASSGVPRR